MKLTLVGRPNQIVERKDVVILGLLTAAAPPPLHKGLPQLPPQPTTYMVFISQKQWKKVTDALTNPDDQLIVEGYPVYDPRFTGITVYATKVTTKVLQQAKQQQQEQPQPHA